MSTCRCGAKIHASVSIDSKVLLGQTNSYGFDFCQECFEIFDKKIVPNIFNLILVEKTKEVNEITADIIAESKRSMARSDLLKGKHTKVLLKWLASARACGGVFEWHGHEIPIEQLKEELAKREHVPNKAEAKILRQALAKKKKNR